MSDGKKLSPYKLHIDEEGYPLFDGIRVDDEEFLYSIFSNMKRMNPEELRSPIVVERENENVLVEAFDTPLVARMVENIGQTTAVWVFPGSFRSIVAFKEIRIDPWNRLHASIGDAKIPAVLSRKAQNELLKNIDVSQCQFPEHRRVEERKVDEEGFWSECYQDGSDGWELGSLTPNLSHYSSSFLKKQDKVLVPGAGRGHEMIYFEEKGLQVTGIDLSPEAKREFHKLYPQSKADYKVEDLFEFYPSNESTFHGVFELYIFCAINPEKRRLYLESLHRSLKSGGYYFGVFFLGDTPSGPPFGLTQWELREMTKDLFQILQWEVSEVSVKRRRGFELWVVFQKK